MSPKVGCQTTFGPNAMPVQSSGAFALTTAFRARKPCRQKKSGGPFCRRCVVFFLAEDHSIPASAISCSIEFSMCSPGSRRSKDTLTTRHSVYRMHGLSLIFLVLFAYIHLAFNDLNFISNFPPQKVICPSSTLPLR